MSVIEELYEDIKAETINVNRINSELEILRDKSELLEKKIALNKLLH